MKKWNIVKHTVIYGIGYQNNGNGTSENTLIVDTLPPSTTYAADTSGLPLVLDGSTITWNLSSVDPGTYGEFYVALDIDSGFTPESNLDPNCVAITTTTQGDYDPNNDRGCDEGAWVTDGEFGVGVDKWPHDDTNLSATFEYWDSGEDEFWTFGGDVSHDFDESVTASIGTLFELFRYDPLRGQENEDVQVSYAKLRYEISQDTRLRAKFEYEDGESDEFFTWTLGMQVSF